MFTSFFATLSSMFKNINKTKRSTLYKQRFSIFKSKTFSPHTVSSRTGRTRWATLRAAPQKFQLIPPAHTTLQLSPSQPVSGRPKTEPARPRPTVVRTQPALGQLTEVSTVVGLDGYSSTGNSSSISSPGLQNHTTRVLQKLQKRKPRLPRPA